ncbi:hypothetical protein CPB97_008335 [Podila verticillata]|nr:hypothetical protein CPB97_008335 [Podila verticillata]
MVTGVFPPPLFAVKDSEHQPPLCPHPHPTKDLLSSPPSSSQHLDPSLSSPFTTTTHTTPGTPSSPVFSPPISPLYTKQVYNHHHNLYSRFKTIGTSDTQQQRDHLYKPENVPSSSSFSSSLPSAAPSRTNSHSLHSTVQDHPSYQHKHTPQNVSNKQHQQYTTIAQQFHHPQQKPSHGCHPLNQPVIQQRLLTNPTAVVSTNNPTPIATKSRSSSVSSPSSAPIISTTPMHIWEHPQERKFVLSSPPEFPPRGRKSSVDSINSVHSAHSVHSVGSIVKNSPFLQQEQKQQEQKQQQQQPSPSFLKHHRKRSSTQGELALVMSMGLKIQNQLASPSMSPSPGRYQLTRRLSELTPVREQFLEEHKEQPKAMPKELPKELPKVLPNKVPKEQPKETPSTPSLATSTTITSQTSYENLLEQIAAQRAKLLVLEAGSEALTKDVAVLDETLDEEQESMDQIMTATQRAVHGWEGVWSLYAKCEPVQALQSRPGTLADLIRGMKWQDKKAL